MTSWTWARRAAVDHLLVRGVGLGVPQVLPHRAVQQVGLLGDDADDAGEVGQRQVADVDAVDEHPTGGRVVEPGHQGGQRALARAGLADQRQRGPGGHGEVDVGQRRPGAVGVAEADPLEADLAAHGGRVDGDRVLGVVDVDGQVQVLEDPAEQRHGGGQRDADVEQLHERAEQRALQRGEGDQRADGHAPGRRGQPGGQVDQRGDAGEDDAHRGHPPAAGQLGADLEVASRIATCRRTAATAPAPRPGSCRAGRR